MGVAMGAERERDRVGKVDFKEGGSGLWGTDI